MDQDLAPHLLTHIRFPDKTEHIRINAVLLYLLGFVLPYPGIFFKISSNHLISSYAFIQANRADASSLIRWHISLSKEYNFHFRLAPQIYVVRQMLTKRNKQVKPLPVPRSGIGRGFEHRVYHRSVVEKFFSKVFKISWFFRFREHWILKSANLSTGCYSIMGQNMGQTVLRETEEFFFELFDPQNERKSPEILRFQDFLWCECS